jgi:hypothetical protein
MSPKTEVKTDIYVTLVHGTWPRGMIPSPSRLWGGGRYWFETGSAFWSALHNSLEARDLLRSSRVNVLLWSGANSIMERDRAAQLLADVIATEKRQNPDARQLVVAHSHGGNVALRALHKLPADFPSISVVTIATPFLEVRPTRQTRVIINRMRRKHRPMLVTLSPLSPWLWLRAIKRQRKLQSASTLGGFRTGLLQHRLFILRAIDDEAALVLAAGAIGNRMMAALGQLLGFLWIVVIPATAALVLIAWLWGVNMSSAFLDLSDYGWFGNALNLLMAGLYISTPFLTLPFLVGNSVYGRELWWGCWWAEINSQSVPDCLGQQAITLTLPQMSGGKRHMLYKTPECAELVVQFLLHGRLAFKLSGSAKESADANSLAEKGHIQG